jgi:hypothetical protein
VGVNLRGELYPEIAAGSCLHLASVLQEGRKSAKIYAASAVIRGIPDEARRVAHNAD